MLEHCKFEEPPQDGVTLKQIKVPNLNIFLVLVNKLLLQRNTNFSNCRRFALAFFVVYNFFKTIILHFHNVPVKAFFFKEIKVLCIKSVAK